MAIGTLLALTSTPRANAATPTRCPVTAAEVRAAFGQPLAGPKRPLNAYEVCVFGRTTPGNYRIVQVSVYTAAILKSLGSSATAYLKSNKQPGAKTVAHVGVEAFVQGEDIWLRTRSGSVIDIGADFVVTPASLVRIARAAAARV